MNLSVGPVAAVGRLRKIALIGATPTFYDAPWQDDSWEIWSHSSLFAMCRKADVTPTRYFDLHHLYDRPLLKVKPYLNWLHTNPVPIFMQQRYPEVPASVTYPKDRILAEFRPYIANQVGWMIALALTEGVTHLGFWGITYGTDRERASQRGSCEYWMGFAEGRGVRLVLPAHCSLLRVPSLLYGYESHPQGTLSTDYLKGSTDVLPVAKKDGRLRQHRRRQRHRARDDRRRVQRTQRNHPLHGPR